VLAGRLSPSYGIYSGYESFETRAGAPGSEAYLDSEKFEVREALRSTAHLLPLVQRRTRCGVRSPRCSASRTSGLRDRERQADRVREGRREARHQLEFRSPNRKGRA